MWSVSDVNHVSGTDLEIFGLPSTIRTCGLRLRSCKNEVKQQQKDGINVLKSGMARHRDQ